VQKIMKIVYVDIAVDGHHTSYLSELVKGNEAESVLILPERIESLQCKQYVFSPVDMHNKKLGAFYRWIMEVSAFVEQEKPDIVHFVFGDIFYKFFGLGLGKFRKYKVIVAFHRTRTGFLEKISTRRICRKASAAVVHSNYMKNEIEEYGARHVVCIDYPQFSTAQVDRDEALNFWKLDKTIPVIACIGNTRFEKGLDILLEALKSVKVPFQILIAGKEDAFDKKFIEEQTKSYSSHVTMYMQFLNDEELNNAFSAATIIALPYRRTFEAASGPMGEGVRLGKCIVGSDHGNLGNTIRENHLGYVFEPENPAALAEAITMALEGEFEADAQYRAFQDALNPEIFVRKHKALYTGLL